MFLTSGEDSLSSREKKKSKETQERKHTKREREKRTKKEKKAPLLSLCFCCLLLFLSLSLSLSCFFFWLSFLSLEVFLSQEECVSVSLSPAILMNLREVFRERHFAAQKRALQREKRERERKRRERARARKRTLFTDGSFSPLLFLSAITARN
jgi:di/tricarboxylate transporter